MSKSTAAVRCMNLWASVVPLFTCQHQVSQQSSCAEFEPWLVIVTASLHLKSHNLVYGQEIWAVVWIQTSWGLNFCRLKMWLSESLVWRSMCLSSMKLADYETIINMETIQVCCVVKIGGCVCNICIGICLFSVHACVLTRLFIYHSTKHCWCDLLRQALL